MQFLVIVVLLGVSAVGSLHSIDSTAVKPKLRQVRLPLLEAGRQGRITNGNEAIPKQFPYQAGLLIESLTGYYFWCGGTIISDQWVLTSAGCVVDTLSIEVILGTVRSNPVGNIGEIVLDIEVTNKTVIVHPEYDYWTLTNDIALIRLPELVTFSEYIKPARLPSFSGRAPTYSWETAIATGWGKISDASESISLLLQWADIEVITNAKCATIFGRLETTHLCARGMLGKSSCDADTGGPLVLQGTDTIIGVHSFSVFGGCELGYPAGFSRVTSFLTWIDKVSGVRP